MTNDQTPSASRHDAEAPETMALDVTENHITENDTSTRHGDTMHNDTVAITGTQDTARLDDLFPDAETTDAETTTGALAANSVAPEPIWITGPAPAPIVIGLIGLLTLAGCAIWALTDWTVNWSLAAPAAVVGVGLVIIGLGVAGLRRPRPTT